MTRLEKFKRSIVALCAVAAMIAVMVTPAQAAYSVKMGACVSEIEPGKEYIIESVKFPGMVATPDSRAKYKDYIGLAKFNSSDPWGCQQVWHFTDYDTHFVTMPWGDRYEESYTRTGYVMISNHTSYRGESDTLRMITYDAKRGYTAKVPEYNDDHSISDKQWFKWTKPYKKNGNQVFRIYGVSSGCGMAPGGHLDVYLHEPIER